jgi:hypothetical protein
MSIRRLTDRRLLLLLAVAAAGAFMSAGLAIAAGDPVSLSSSIVTATCFSLLVGDGAARLPSVENS